ncbi:hypothetical protein AX15_000171 [Amanita polypyramis BW_CC]|nr:hypothetical protein AX15_000171 [Amanita polypyramis BW_CC]
MGAGQSTSQVHSPVRTLHVLRVTPLSPASKTDIEPYFDFVVGFEGSSLPSENLDANQLERIVEAHEGRTLRLLVWNSKNKQTRVVPIVPSRKWSLQSDEANNSDPNFSPSLLGLSMRICEPEKSTDNVWHVLDVIEGSPAESAGLVPMGDWILGWSGGVLGAENDFYDLIESHVDKPLRVYVYSYDFDTTREVVLIPNRHWGGEGLLGCVFGYGLLHRIPRQPEDRVPGTIPPELSESDNHELFIPADVQPDTRQSQEQHLADWQRDQRYNHDSQRAHPSHASPRASLDHNQNSASRRSSLLT